MGTAERPELFAQFEFAVNGREPGRCRLRVRRAPSARGRVGSVRPGRGLWLEATMGESNDATSGGGTRTREGGSAIGDIRITAKLTRLDHKKNECRKSPPEVAQSAVRLLASDPRFGNWLRGRGGVQERADIEDVVGDAVERLLRWPPANDNGIAPAGAAWRALKLARKDYFRSVRRHQRLMTELKGDGRGNHDDGR